jgi:hypothetical protein
MRSIHGIELRTTSPELAGLYFQPFLRVEPIHPVDAGAEWSFAPVGRDWTGKGEIKCRNPLHTTEMGTRSRFFQNSGLREKRAKSAPSFLSSSRKADLTQAVRFTSAARRF